MASKDRSGGGDGSAAGGGGFLSTVSSYFSSATSAVHKSVNSVSGLMGYEGLEVINPEGGIEDAEEETQTGRKQEDRESYWKMMQKYIGSDITSMVTFPVLIFEPMTAIQKIAELMEYSSLLDKADECEDPYMRLVYATSWAISVYYAYQRTWRPFNPILGETSEMTNHGGMTFISEQDVSRHFQENHGQIRQNNVAVTRIKYCGYKNGAILLARKTVTNAWSVLIGQQKFTLGALFSYK